MFWNNYLKYCNKVGKSPNAVAAEIGVKSTGTVTGWKKGAKPRQNVLVALTDYFKCSIDDLMREETAEKPAPIVEGGSEWVNRLSNLEAQDLELVSRVVEQLRDNPKAMRAALGLALQAVQFPVQSE